MVRALGQATARDVVALAALFALALGGLWLMHARALADSDRHFHFAVSRDTVERGRLTSIPQVEDIGWAQRFVDKEYLFHALTSVGWRLGERRGVEAVAWALALAVVGLLYAAARRFSEPGVAAALVAAFIVSPPFIYRLALLRPHVFAIAAVLLLVRALLGREDGDGTARRFGWPEALAFIAGVVFALGYHALYVPLAVLGVFALFDGKARWRAVLLGVVGLAVGTVVNPYFPDTLRITWMTLTIATSMPTSDTLGVELLPLEPGVLVTRYAVPFVLALVALGVTVRARREAGTRVRVAVVVLALGFWVLTLRSARAAEYAVPFSLVAAAAVVPLVRLRAAVGVLVGLAVVQVPFAVRFAEPDLLDGYTRHIEDAVAALPSEAAGQKVLNCSFTEGEVMLDLRPDVRFVDVLDPTFLALKDPVRHQLRRGLLKGQASDLRELVQERFGARYVICGYPPARALLDGDARFVRLRPPPGPPLPPGSGPYVYELRE